MKIAFLSDIHEDLDNLQKAIKHAESENCDSIICLGDTLGYPSKRGKYGNSKNVNACIEILRKEGTKTICGNHDLFHLKRFPKHATGISIPENWYELPPPEKTSTTDGLVWNYSDDDPVILSDENISFMLSTEEYEILSTTDCNIFLSHFVAPNISGFISTFKGKEKKLKAHFNCMEQNNCSISICGHLHVEGTGICYNSNNNFFNELIGGFEFFPFGEKQLKNKYCCISIPAVADHGQNNGFAILDTKHKTIKTIPFNKRNIFFNNYYTL